MLESFDLDEHERVLLLAACRTADLLDRLAVEADGALTVTNRFGEVVAAPAVVEHRQQSQTLARAARVVAAPGGRAGRGGPSAAARWGAGLVRAEVRVRRRAQHRGPVVVPAWAASFDPAEWDDVGVGDAASRLVMARDRWREARDAWAREHGWSWVDEIRDRHDARRAAAGVGSPLTRRCGRSRQIRR